MVEIAPVNNYKLLSLKTPLILDEEQTVFLKGEICNKSLLVDTYQYIYPCDDLLIKLEPQKLKMLVPKNKTDLVSKIKRIFIHNGYNN